MENGVKDLLESKKIENKRTGIRSKTSKGKKIVKTILIFFGIIFLFFVFIGFLDDDENDSQSQSETSSSQIINTLIYPDLKLGNLKNEVTEKCKTKFLFNGNHIQKMKV